MAESIDDLVRRVNAGDLAAHHVLAAQLDASGRHSDALGALARAARLGDADAKLKVGARLLLGDRAPAMPKDGLRLIEEAAQVSGEAAHLAASLAGAGVHRRASWPDALDHLERAAVLGLDRAGRALSVLAGEDGSAPSTDGTAPPEQRWRRLRARIDVDALLAPPPGRTLCGEPAIRLFEGFAAPAVCAWLVGRAQGRLHRARVYNGITQRDETHAMRSNTAASFALLDVDLVQLAVQARMAAALGVPHAWMEPPAILHYDVGEEIREHFDFVDPSIANYEEQIARDGQRIATFLLYLNDGYAGGETDFPRLGVSHKARIGDGLVFMNALASGAADVRSVHAGRPPASGEKWVVSQFVRNRPVIPGA